MKFYRIFPKFTFLFAGVPVLASGLEQADQNQSRIQAVLKEKQSSKNIWTPNRKKSTTKNVSILHKRILNLFQEKRNLDEEDDCCCIEEMDDNTDSASGIDITTVPSSMKSNTPSTNPSTNPSMSQLPSNSPSTRADLIELSMNKIYEGLGVLPYYWTDPDYCNWVGVDCDEGEVTDMYFSGNDIDGTLSTYLGNLDQLEYLYLEGEGLTGTIPDGSSFDKLSNLDVIIIEETRLSGSLPDWIFEKTKSGIIIMESKISGTLPSAIGLFQGYVIELDENVITGVLPTNLGDLHNITNLYVKRNWITGTLPTELGLLTSIDVLNFEMNLISGSLPSELAAADIYWSDFAHNRITGKIPSELGLTTELDRMYLESNKLTGTLPTELETIALRDDFLDLERNFGLYGTAPSTICDRFDLDYTNIVCPTLW